MRNFPRALSHRGCSSAAGVPTPGYVPAFTGTVVATDAPVAAFNADETVVLAPPPAVGLAPPGELAVPGPGSVVVAPFTAPTSSADVVAVDSLPAATCCPP